MLITLTTSSGTPFEFSGMSMPMSMGVAAEVLATTVFWTGELVMATCTVSPASFDPPVRRKSDVCMRDTLVPGRTAVSAASPATEYT